MLYPDFIVVFRYVKNAFLYDWLFFNERLIKKTPVFLKNIPSGKKDRLFPLTTRGRVIFLLYKIENKMKKSK